MENNVLRFKTREQVYKLYRDGFIDKDEAEEAMGCSIKFFTVCQNTGE
jgi:hypothetical protein